MQEGSAGELQESFLLSPVSDLTGSAEYLVIPFPSHALCAVTLQGHEPVLLRTQYRCHPAISAVANELFYEGHLIDGVSEEERRPLLHWLPTLCFYSVTGVEQVGFSTLLVEKVAVVVLPPLTSYL